MFLRCTVATVVKWVDGMYSFYTLFIYTRGALGWINQTDMTRQTKDLRTQADACLMHTIVVEGLGGSTLNNQINCINYINEKD